MNDHTLLEDWLDGSLDDAGVAELARQAEAEPAVAASLAQAARMDLLLAMAHGQGRDLVPGVMAGLRGQESRAALRRAVMRGIGRRSGVRFWPAAAALVALLVILALALLPPADLPVLGSVVAADATAILERGGRQLPAAAGAPLHRGDLLRAGAGTLRVDVCGADIGLAAGSELVADDAILHLRRGRLRAEVRPHQADAPLVIVTGSARATVLGTVLSLSVAEDATRLEVERGRVRIAAGGAAVEVAAGGSAVVRPGLPPRMPQPLFPDGLAGWTVERGSWTAEAGLVRGGDPGQRSRLATRAGHGDLELSCRVRVQGVDAAEVQVGAYSWFAVIPAGGWREVAVRVAGGDVSCLIDGRAVQLQPGREEGRTTRGDLGFYVRAGGTIEIAAGRLLSWNASLP